MTDIQKRFVDLDNRAFNMGYCVYTDFLGLSEISELFACRFSSSVTVFGGYDDSERVVACFGDREYFTDFEDFPIKCILIEPVNQKFADALTHRDFLGSLMGLGIRREMLGDIIISENCGYLFCIDTVAEYILDNLKQVKHTTVKLTVTDEVPVNALPTPENMETTVTSERLDVLVAAVYKLSRSKVKVLCDSEKVYVNGVVKNNSSYMVNENDKISVRGYGRFVYKGILRHTKKDRLAIKLEIYK